jgi:RNA polymerase primary sigma factor
MPKKNTIIIENENIKRYFKDIHNIYEKELDPDNMSREEIIERSTKSVIYFAKKYVGLGLTLSELISAGNEGLVVSYNKYKKCNNIKRDTLLKKLDETKEITLNWIETYIKPLCEYGRLLKNYDKLIKKNNFPKEHIRKWINSNIKNASFNSVSSLWILAYIRNEITSRANIIRKSNKDTKIITIDIEDNSNGEYTLEDILVDTPNEYDDEEDTQIWLDSLDKLFRGISSKNRKIIMERFGIGLPRALTPREISNRENISVTRISQILTESLNIMKENADYYKLDKNILYRVVSNKNIF